MSDFNIDDELNEVETEVSKALARAVQDGYSKGKRDFQRTYKGTPYQIWKEGYQMYALSKDEYIISLTGNFAMLFDEGGDIAKELMKTPRAKKQGYLDIPLMKDADAAGNVKTDKGTVNVKAFSNADQIANHFKKADATRKNKFKKVFAKVKRAPKSDLLQSTQPAQQPKYLVVKRITNSTNWNKHPAAGVMTDSGMESLSRYIEQQFDKYIQGVI